MMNLELRERIAGEILGAPVKDGDTMRCRFEIKHSHQNGARDMRVCLTETGGKLPTFFCFHSSCEDDWRPLNRELRRKIWFAEHGRTPDRGSPWSEGRRVAAAPGGPGPAARAFDLDALKAIFRPEIGADRAFFARKSPVNVAETGPATFLGHLYEPGERVLVFTRFGSQGQFLEWVGRGSYRLGNRPDVRAVPSALPAGGPDGVWFLCQPVSGKWEPNPRNPDPETGTLKLSRRSMESVTAWRYLVLESDQAPENLWLSFLATVPLPLAAIYSSGGRSIHALFRVYARSKEEWDGIKRVFVGVLTKLGADKGALSAVRLTRLPGCWRGARKQELIYLNPKPEPGGVPICEL